MKHMRRGAVAVEFAFIVPILIILFAGTVEVTQFIKAQSAFQRAVASTLNVVTLQTGVTSNKMNDFCVGAVLSMYPFNTSTLAMTIASVTNNSGSVVRDWEYSSPCPTSATALGPSGATTVATNMVPTSGDSAIVIRANYVYTPIFKTFIPVSVPMTRTGFSRPRHGGVPCSSGC